MEPVVMEALVMAVERAPTVVAPRVPAGMTHGGRWCGGRRQEDPREYRAAKHSELNGTRARRGIQLAAA